MVSSRPAGLAAMSARVSAASSERRSAEANPSRISVASRAPWALLRSIRVTMARISATDSGRA